MSNLRTTQTEDHALHDSGMASASTPALPGDEQLAPSLTPRQSQVLDLLCEGLSDKLIARKLDLSHHTVRGHVQILYGMLRVSTRMQAMFAARKHGLIN
jgi:DNA-binding NarL/FixJ family response regulator